jgi:starch phosphorylase
MQIIYRINAQHLDGVKRAGHATHESLEAVSLIDENHGRRVRMGHLAFIGSHRVNGVSALHTDLMRQTVFKELHGVHPTRIVNKTNGVTFRRWLFQANPRLTQLLVSACGDAIFENPAELVRSAAFADDGAFQQRVGAIKRANKIALARLIGERLDLRVDPSALFDVQIKRFHEYKRQLLNVVETVALYQAMRDEPGRHWTPRVKIFSGKAAASYRQAKLIIKLINDVAGVINNDPAVRGLLKVAFVPDYNVSVAETIIPAADLSEQISTAGMEASGTGNMKLALNGALTIGTLDGANVEIQEHVGEANIFIFGLLANEVKEHRRHGLDAGLVVALSPRLARAINAIAGGEFSPDEPDRFLPLTNALQYSDFYMVSTDFDAYYETQRRIDRLWDSTPDWTRTSILNIANMGWFSSDRTIREYAADIWGVPVEK